MKNLNNSVTLIGNLGRDPEVLELKNGGILAKVSLATNESYKNSKGERITNTYWHNCVAYGKTADLMQSLLTKGKKVAFNGKLSYRDYEDKAGIKRKLSEVIVSEFILLDKMKKE